MGRVMEQLEREKSLMLAALVYMLNLFDLFCSLYAINNGATELNPLMQSVLVMAVWKGAVVWALCWLLYVFATDIRVGHKAQKLSRRGLRICAAAFAAVDLYHIYSILGGAFL